MNGKIILKSSQKLVKIKINVIEQYLFGLLKLLPYLGNNIPTTSQLVL